MKPLVSFSTGITIGKTYNIGKGFTLNFDTFNKQSWGSSPENIDIAVLYPVDSLNEKTGDENLQNILHREPNKIHLVTWTDDQDFDWIDYFDPIRISYDAKEENPEYHERMKEIEKSTHKKRHTIKNLPKYARNVEPEYLIKVLCRGGCGGTRWAKLNHKFPGQTALRNAAMGEFQATCLRCGYVAHDNYNWYR